MEGLEWGKVLHFGSHNAPRLGLYAAKTMLESMLAGSGAGYRELADIGERMTESARAAIRASNRHRAIVQGVGSMFQIFFTHREEIGNYREFCAHVDRGKFRDFVLALHRKGVFMSPSNTLHSLSCLAHTDADIEATANAIGTVLDEL
jgi:glutamate-1-semialdehyde 2,1-aminomutase